MPSRLLLGVREELTGCPKTAASLQLDFVLRVALSNNFPKGGPFSESPACNDRYWTCDPFRTAPAFPRRVPTG